MIILSNPILLVQSPLTIKTLPNVVISTFESEMEMFSRILKNIEASQEGFEPPTYSLEGCCSIQLSYWDLCMERVRSEEHTSELQSRFDLVCRLLLEKKSTERASRR